VHSCFKYGRLLCAAIAILGTGCVGVIHTPYGGPASANEPTAIQPLNGNDYFAYTPRPFIPDWQQAATPAEDPYNKFSLTFPPSLPDAPILHSIEAIYYQSKQPAAKPLIIILPIWGSYTYPPERLAKLIQKKSRGGANILQVNGDATLFDWNRMKAAASEEEFVQLSSDYYEKIVSVVIGLRHIVDWAKAESDLDANRIGVTGFSMGAIVAAIALGRDPRFRAGVLVMGAGNPGEVFATCDGKPGAVRDTIMDRFDWSIEQYQAIFDELFKPGDPEKFRGRYQPEKLLIVEASLDNCMSKAAREALWDATGEPERIKLLARHKMAFLSMTPLSLNYTTRKIYTFLERQLDISDISDK
jgi:predicted esterase